MISEDNLVLPITGTYNVRVQCYEHQDPDLHDCPATTTTTTQRTTTEVQQQIITATPQNTSQHNKGTGSASNGDSIESDSSDITNLCVYSIEVLGSSIQGLLFNLQTICNYYRLPTRLLEGNVSVCLYVHREGSHVTIIHVRAHKPLTSLDRDLTPPWPPARPQDMGPHWTGTLPLVLTSDGY